MEWNEIKWADIDDCSICPFSSCAHSHLCNLNNPDDYAPCRDRIFNDNATCQDIINLCNADMDEKIKEHEENLRLEREKAEKRAIAARKARKTMMKNREANKEIVRQRKDDQNRNAAEAFKKIFELFNIK